jgi:NADH dehydrogenase
VQVYPYNFENREALVDSLRGVSTLINTYWVRFPHGSVTFEAAVRNTQLLIEAAKSAGVERIVHVSIANPSLDSPLGYYRGKAELERAVMDSGLSYAIVRPTVIFGTEDILINNLAWFLRKFPVFAIPGDGQYRVRPIYVEDMAALLVASAESRSNTVTNAVGPETFTFHELVRTIGDAIGNSPALLHVPAAVAYAATRVTGWFLGDVILTWEEYKGLMAGLLAPEGPATGETCLTRWLAENAKTVGRKYASEVARHYSIQNHF